MRGRVHVERQRRSSQVRVSAGRVSRAVDHDASGLVDDRNQSLCVERGDPGKVDGADARCPRGERVSRSDE